MHGEAQSAHARVVDQRARRFVGHGLARGGDELLQQSQGDHPEGEANGLGCHPVRKVHTDLRNPCRAVEPRSLHLHKEPIASQQHALPARVRRQRAELRHGDHRATGSNGRVTWVSRHAWHCGIEGPHPGYGRGRPASAPEIRHACRRACLSRTCRRHLGTEQARRARWGG